MAVVSPSVFATLSTNASSKLLRKIFPRMFLFGFIIAILSLILSYISDNILYSILLVIVAVINPNKNIRGKIVLNNLLLALELKVAKTEGETTAIKKIIDPVKTANKKLRV